MYNIKSNVQSEILRSDGNKFYSQRNFHDALLKYNESLCFAELGSENLGLAYANRSAVYFEMKIFERCLKNIEMAKLNNYPEKTLDLLRKREEKCNEIMKNQSLNQSEKFYDPWNFFKLSYPPNKKLPFIANCLEVDCNEQFGRYIVTNKQLNVGDIVAIEKPFCSVLLAESPFVEIPTSNILQNCTNCLKANYLDLIPCELCCKGENNSDVLKSDNSFKWVNHFSDVLFN